MEYGSAGNPEPSCELRTDPVTPPQASNGPQPSLFLATARSIFLTWPCTHVPPTNMLLTKRQRLTAVKGTSVPQKKFKKKTSHSYTMVLQNHDKQESML